MPGVPDIEASRSELQRWRRDIHAHPELGFQEQRTADFVAEKLREFGLAVHTGIGGTGVVGVLQNGNETATVGLRADMDALPIHEENTFAHRSTHAGTMHACGHDGHTTMLLGAAQYLARTRNFRGRVHFIFQPAEEGLGGAQAMVDDGLFENFPCDNLFAMHNAPGMPVGTFGVKTGVVTAAGPSSTVHAVATVLIGWGVPVAYHPVRLHARWLAPKSCRTATAKPARNSSSGWPCQVGYSAAYGEGVFPEHLLVNTEGVANWEFLA